jgi:hypothetical protein
MYSLIIHAIADIMACLIGLCPLTSVARNWEGEMPNNTISPEANKLEPNAKHLYYSIGKEGVHQHNSAEQEKSQSFQAQDV